MKKLCIVLVLALSLSLYGCGSSNTSSSEQSQSAETEEDSEASSENIEVDENLITVEITIPATLAGETTQEELNQALTENGYKSATLNDDGSVTYVMSKAKHRELMQEMTSTINESLNDMIGSEEYPSFTKIEANDDFTEFTVTTTSTELSLTESFSVLGFYMYGGLYNAFNGTQTDNISVTFVNADTGEVIQTSNSSDL